MRNIKLFLFLVLLFTSGFVFAQQKEITGKVIDQATGQPISGVSVLSNNSKGGTTTKKDGTYSLSLKGKSNTLIFSSIGYGSQTIPIDGKSVVDISMNVQVKKDEEEVVVIGYGTVKKSSLTGAVSKYKNERLDEAPVSRLDQALQGKIAGVVIQNTSSEAGAAPKINIRGVTSINAGGSPLIIVDGQPIPDGLAFVNMADVESVEVLKDAASAAIYGSRGASGVILITTKSGKSDKTKYNVKYSIGRKTDYKRYDILTSSEYVNLLYKEAALRFPDSTAYMAQFTGSATQIEAAKAAFRTNRGNLITVAEKAEYVIEQNLRNGEVTDWQSESLRPGIFQNVQLSASGGSNAARYFISGGFLKDEGLMNKSNFERYTVRAKLDMQLSRRIKLNVNINPSYSTRETPSENFTNFYRYPSFLPVYHNELTAAAVNTIPQWAGIRPGDFAQPRHFSGVVYSGTMPDGSLFAPTAADPFSSAQNTPRSSVLNQDQNTKEYRLQTSADLGINILPGLDFKSLASFYINSSSGLNFSKRNAQADGTVSRGVFLAGTSTDVLSENTFTYKKTIQNHSFNVLGGFTYQKTNTIRSQTTGLDFPNDNIRTLNQASQIDKNGTFGLETPVGLISYLGRVNYDYKNKYLVSASFRTDGSSYFGPGQKWGSFPSISLGWVATQEKFLQDATWLNKLKFRGSYGATGNNTISAFSYLDLLYGGNYSFGGGTGVLSSGQVGSSINIAKPDITWERTFSTNFGVDISILKNKIGLTVDAYQSKTERLLLQQSVQAFAGVPQYFNNIGSLKNKGIEVELNTVNIDKRKFKWTTSANYSRTRNEILELGAEAFLLNQGERGEVYQNKIGDPLVNFVGFKTDGVWLSQAQIDEARAKGLTSNLGGLFVPGGLKLVDVNGDNVIDNKDRTIIGTPYPTFTWGVTNAFTYKAFDASFTLQGVQGGQVINGDANYNESKRRLRVFNENRWISPANPGDGKTPYSTIGFNTMLTDFVVTDASYAALREVNVGYRLPNAIAKYIKLSSLRVYFAGQNLWFKSAKDFTGINPEGRANNGPYSSALIDGYQRGSFPIQKTYVIGIDINF